MAFGEGLIDFLPVAAKKSLSEVEQFIKVSGGAIANVAVAVAKLGGSSYFAGKLGADHFGDFLTDTLKRYGVNTKYVIRTNKARTGIVFISETESGQTECLPYRNPSADMLFEPEDINISWFEQVGIFHFGSDTLIYPESFKTTVKAVEYAEKAGAFISFDPNFRLSLWNSNKDLIEKLEQLLPMIDIMKVNEFEYNILLKIITNSDIIGSLLQKGVSIVIKTKGNEKTEYYTKDFSGEIIVPKTDPVDPLGAGDAFVGGLLYKLSLIDSSQEDIKSVLLNKEKVESLIKFANSCGVLATRVKGAIPSFPSLEMIEKQWRE